MEAGSGSDSRAKPGLRRERGAVAAAANTKCNATNATTLGSTLPKLEPFVRKDGHNPTDLRSWAKRTGFVSTSTNLGSSAGFDLEKGLGGDHRRFGGSSPTIEIDPVLGRTRPNRGNEIELDFGSGTGSGSGDGFRSANDRRGLELSDEDNRRAVGNELVFVIREEEKKVELNRNGNEVGRGHGDGGANRNGNVNKTGDEIPLVKQGLEPKKEGQDGGNVGIDGYLGGEEPADAGWNRQSEMKYGFRDNPGFVPLIHYGLQHYLSLAGSLIFIPLIIVPSMGGSDKDTATVISTMLLISGITTILHSYFGTRLPLVQ